MFFNQWLDVRDAEPRMSERRRIGLVAERLRKQAQGLIHTPLENGDADVGLGFSLFVRRRGRAAKQSPAEDLLRDW